MKRNILFSTLSATALLALAMACSDSDEAKAGGVNPPLSDKWYSNPVIKVDTPDPSVVRAENGHFYLYGTGGNTSVYESTDLVHWTFRGTAFTEDAKPTWEKGGGIWAPDINYVDGKYVLYYSMSVWGGGNTCGIGVALADKPEGPFTDQGKMFRSNEIGVHNSIDPFYIEDNGKKYLFWGSFFGIYAVQLSDDGLSVLPETKQQIAGTAYEGTYIYKKDGYYYLFASIGSCCEGLNSTYTTVVGRSEHLMGPYVNRAGERMLDNKHEEFIRKNASFVGTGHNSEIVTDDNGSTWMLYHGYLSSKPDLGRTVLLDRVYWDDDKWPFVIGNTPSIKAVVPYFENK